MHLLIPSKSTPAKNAWVGELRVLDLSPLLEILETIEGTKKEASIRENHWIKHFLSLGMSLMNITGNEQHRTAVSIPHLKWEYATSVPLLSTVQCAQQLDTSEGMVKRWLRNGELPGYKINGFWRVNPADLEQFLSGRKRRKNQNKPT